MNEKCKIQYESATSVVRLWSRSRGQWCDGVWEGKPVQEVVTDAVMLLSSPLQDRWLIPQLLALVLQDLCWVPLQELPSVKGSLLSQGVPSHIQWLIPVGRRGVLVIKIWAPLLTSLCSRRTTLKGYRLQDDLGLSWALDNKCIVLPLLSLPGRLLSFTHRCWSWRHSQWTFLLQIFISDSVFLEKQNLFAKTAITNYGELSVFNKRNALPHSCRS